MAKYINVDNATYDRLEAIKAQGNHGTWNDAMKKVADVFEGIERPEKTGIHWVTEDEWLNMVERIAGLEEEISRVRIEMQNVQISRLPPLSARLEASPISIPQKAKTGHFTPEGLERMRKLSKERYKDRKHCPKCSAFMKKDNTCTFCDDGKKRANCATCGAFLKSDGKCPYCVEGKIRDKCKNCSSYKIDNAACPKCGKL